MVILFVWDTNRNLIPEAKPIDVKPSCLFFHFQEMQNMKYTIDALSLISLHDSLGLAVSCCLTTFCSGLGCVGGELKIKGNLSLARDLPGLGDPSFGLCDIRPLALLKSMSTDTSSVNHHIH